MEFLSRSGGAQGGLIKGNLFAQSGMPAYSNTRHGDSVIHTKDGRISITREKPQDDFPYLLTPYYYGAEPRLLRAALETDATQTDEHVGGALNTDITGRGVFVGDGYFLCLESDGPATNSRPVLINIYDPDAPLVSAGSADNVPGANVQLDAQWLMDVAVSQGYVFPSCMACGWRDEVRRYGFAVFGILDEGVGAVFASRYVCIVGDTGTRTAALHLLPTLPDSDIPLLRSYSSISGAPIYEYKTGWWGCESIYGVPVINLLDRPASARCYCVGPGHLLTLLTAQERYAYREEAAPNLTTIGYISPYWLPVGSAPYLLRSRDCGETWTMERADFLVSDEPPTADHDQPPHPEAALLLQRTADFGHFIAAPLGGGRVALTALGRNLALPGYDVGGPLARDTLNQLNRLDRAWRFFVSGSGGAGFSNRPWPMDRMRAGPPSPYLDLDASMPRQRTYEHPIFSDLVRQQRTFSFGPGHFVLPSIQYGVDMGTDLRYEWGAYPGDYPVTVHSTYDGGETWMAEALASEAMPYAADLGVYYASRPKPAFEAGSDFWAASFLALGYIEPAEQSRPPIASITSWGFVDGIAIFVSSSTPGAGTYSAMQKVPWLQRSGGAVALPDFGVPWVWRGRNVVEALYSGDHRSGLFPELVFPGYPEFEEPS